jgi:hypothetical protein
LPLTSLRIHHAIPLRHVATVKPPLTRSREICILQRTPPAFQGAPCGPVLAAAILMQWLIWRPDKPFWILGPVITPSLFLLNVGGGIDCLLSAKRVGPSGKVYGLDMTKDMIFLARKNPQKAGFTNIEFLLALWNLFLSPTRASIFSSLIA